jgi:hypothetical protein
VDSAARDEDKYVLEYFTEGERADDEPPFKYRSFYLDDALAEAWRIERGGGSALGITQRGESALDGEALKDALEKMTTLEGEESARDERERAALVLGELGKAAPESDEAAAAQS